MKKIILVLFLLYTAVIAKGQEPQEQDFYLHLINALEGRDSDSITVTTLEYGCLGSQNGWTARIKKVDDLVEVEFYSQILKDSTNPLSGFQARLDTTFTVTKNSLVQKLKEEMRAVKARPVFIEASFKFMVEQGKGKREFVGRRGEGLSYILQFNQSWESYFLKR